MVRLAPRLQVVGEGARHRTRGGCAPQNNGIVPAQSRALNLASPTHHSTGAGGHQQEGEENAPRPHLLR
jgi:hypothetical protein